MEVDLGACPHIDPNLCIRIFHSATSLYHAPSDLSGIGGMHREVIRATPSWLNGPARHDCVFVEKDPDQAGFRGLNIAQVHFFLSFKHDGTEYECAYVRWFEPFGDEPCDATGLWRVRPDYDYWRRCRICSIIHIDSILRCAHLMPVFGSQFIPSSLHHSQTLHAFKLFYVNKYIDYHAYEVAF
jgi:hypothetical protein